MLLWWETQRVLRNIDAMHPQLAASLRDLCQAMNNKSHDDAQEETAMALAGKVFRQVDDIRFAPRIKMPLEWIRTSNPKGFPAALTRDASADAVNIVAWRCLLQFKHSPQVVACGLGAGFGPKVLPVVDVNVLDQAIAIADRAWKKSPGNMRCIQDEEQHRCNSQAYNVALCKIMRHSKFYGIHSSVE